MKEMRADTSQPDPLDQDRPPAGLSLLRQALWWDARGNWSAAHALVATGDSPESARVHAYLHRKEGDDGNARYWYARAGEGPYRGSLDAERNVLLAEIA